MAATYDSLKELRRQTMKGLLNVQNWQKFLAFACRNFKLPFPEQVLVYAQRPEASAVMRSGDWALYNRPVKKGSRGIPVPDGRGRKLKYYYDISDTKETGESKSVPLWTVRPEHREGIVKALESYLGKLEDSAGFAETLLAAARKTAARTLDDRLDDLRAHVGNSLLEELDEDNLRAAYSAIMENSVGYMMLARCGVDAAPYLIDDDFRGLLDFNTPSTLTTLGTAVVETAAMCLSVIAKTVRGMQKTTPALATAESVVPNPTEPTPVTVVPTLRYGQGDHFTIAGASEFVVTVIGPDTVSYCFLDLPEQGPVDASRREFEQWLDAGFLRQVEVAVPA